MNIFLDTSALIKLYHSEAFSEELYDYLSSEGGIHQLIIADLAQAEFASAVWKKVKSPQSADFDEQRGYIMLQLLENDLDRFLITETNAQDIIAARRLINRCNTDGLPLRTLDALQLTAALKMGEAIDVFITFDKALLEIAGYLKFPTKNFYPPDQAAL